MKRLPSLLPRKRKTVSFLPIPHRPSFYREHDPEAFLRAAISNDHNTMREMLATGLDPNAALGDEPILIICAKMGYLDAVTLILQSGPCDDILDSAGLTALHHACIHGYTALVSLLLQAGAFVDTRVCGKGELQSATPLILACMHNRPAAASALLEKKASFDLKDHLGRTALHHACSRLDTDMLVYQLLAAGANAEIADVSGTTPLMYAAMVLNLRVVKALMVWGVGLEVQAGARQREAVYWAKRDKRGSIVTLLEGERGYETVRS